MEIDLKTLLQGKATIIKGKEYLSTEAYVTPFLEKMSNYTDNFIIQASLPPQISLTRQEESSLEDTVFNRVWIQAIMPEEYSVANHKETISIVYGLDTRKPICKIYRGALNMACLNLCVFNPDFLRVQEIEPEQPLDFKCINPLMEQALDVKMYLEKLKNTIVTYNNNFINENLGLWVRKALNYSYDRGYGKVKLATSVAIDAYKLLYEKQDSPYYVKPDTDTDMFNIYNAFTEIITNVDTRDIMNKAEKTLLLKDILDIN